MSITLPAEFPPGGSAGSAGRCEPEAVEPELAPDPASLGGELGSVDDSAAPEEPRALFSFCRCSPPLGLLLECIRVSIHPPCPSRCEDCRIDCQQERYVRIVVPVVQEVVGRGGIEKPLRDTQLELLDVRGLICPLIIGHRMAPLQNSGNHRIKTRKSIPVDLAGSLCRAGPARPRTV